MRVLVIEDEARLGALIRRVLAAEGHRVELAEDGATGAQAAITDPFDVIVLDRGLPDGDGTDRLRALRANGLTTPVLLLTALDSVEERVAGLDAGADDYLAKPFAFEELLARLRALVRRPADEPDRRLRVGDLILDDDRHVAEVRGRTIELSAREFDLLAFLMRHPGQVLSRSQILEAVWGGDEVVRSNVVDLYIHYLRRRLARPGHRDGIRTVRGIGYSLGMDP